MMTDQEVRTLAYAKSPKTSKRTTFQDELQAAVSSRASKTKSQQHFYCDDINEEEDDFLNNLLKSRKKRIDAFKAGRSKATFNTFDLSDEEDKHSKPKKVSFLKAQRSSSMSKDTSASEPHESSNDGNVNNDGSLSSQSSTNVNDENSHINPSGEEPTNCLITKQTSSLSYQTSDDALSFPLPSDGSVVETPGPEEKTRNSVMEETSQTPPVSAPHLNNTVAADSIPEREPPRPKPRQRTLGLKSQVSQKKAEEESASRDFSRPQTSSVSIPLSTDASSNIAWTDGDQTASCSPNKSCSNWSEQSHLVTTSTFDTGSRDGFMSDDSKEQGRHYSSSFEEFNGHPGDPSDQSSHTPKQSFDVGTPSSHSKMTQRSQSACSRKVESKYLGTLKVLDRKLSLQESSPQAAESIRAAVYQEWLKKKNEKSRENMQLKKKEELIKEKQKKERKSKKEDAIASYEAWKEKKAESLKAKAKERQDMVRKEQRECEEKEEKRQSAKQVFENWKREHDQLLKDKNTKQKLAESKQKFQKQEKEEERQRDSKSAFSDWCDKKKDVLHEKFKRELEEMKTKAEEEQYMKEDREKMALETYENWLIRKDREERRRKDERRIQAILRDSPPPPWSPPNKTVPFGK
ncbi:microtubule-associated protein 9 isoform X1 [Girardinichthys multiradiatus]|uniref:microtubule-associated protein 9 isoform X1 n=1 Tax=Girardinichthys multiradiatus TaxID=208333 RepID=UPI001FAB46A8|nr:microtubule-associated protein 9 isoform X1 [Girardinichthys multiradiatus]